MFLFLGISAVLFVPCFSLAFLGFQVFICSMDFWKCCLFFKVFYEISRLFCRCCFSFPGNLYFLRSGISWISRFLSRVFCFFNLGISWIFSPEFVGFAVLGSHFLSMGLTSLDG